MGALRTINHPGVEIREYDVSQYTPLVGGTTSLAMGFATKGEDNVPLEITSRNAFLSYYGTPTNEAEKYFYYAANEIFSQAGRLIAAKIPYDNIVKDLYLETSYTVGTSALLSSLTTTSGYTSADFSGFTTYNGITGGTISSLATSSVDNYRTGTKPAANTFKIVDKTRSILKKDIITSTEIIGYFPVITSAFNALPIQNMLTMSGFNTGDFTEWMSISAIETSAVGVSAQYLALPLATSGIYNNSLSVNLAKQFPAISYNDAGTLDNDYMDKILVSIVAMKNDPNENNKINFSIVESFLGSLDVAAKDINGASVYIGNVINNNSQYVEFYGNISNLVPATGLYKVTPQKSGIFGFTAAQTAKNIKTSTILTSLETIFDRMSNIDETEIDIVVDGGISNIAQYVTDTYTSSSTSGTGGVYDPDGTTGTAWTKTISSRTDTESWRSVIGKYITFCSTTRKDCMFIADGIRPLVLTGKEKIVRAGTSKTLDIDVLGNLKFITGINSNYGAMYINWFKKLDDFSGLTFWMPPSVVANGIYIYTDRTANYWDAPAGLNRGLVYTSVDIAFNPNGKQQDMIYSKSFNYAVNYPYDGITLEGQKTLQTKPSAFDRVNVRRLFLKLERFTYKTARYYTYEGNTEFLRARLVDQLTPIYEDVKTRGGIYDYRLICDKSNNGETSIDNNELRLAVLIKPTKTAEFIICDFYALSTGMSFSEVSL